MSISFSCCECCLFQVTTRRRPAVQPCLASPHSVGSSARELRTLPLLGHTYPPAWACFSEELQMGVFAETRMELTFWDAYHNLETLQSHGIKQNCFIPPTPNPGHVEYDSATRGQKQNPPICKAPELHFLPPREERSGLVSSKQNGQQGDLEPDTWPQVQDLSMSGVLPFLYEKPPPFPRPGHIPISRTPMGRRLCSYTSVTA